MKKEKAYQTYMAEKSKPVIDAEQGSKETEKKPKLSRWWLIRVFQKEISALYICLLDIRNFLLFRKRIKALELDPESDFNKLKLKSNKLGNILYSQILLDETRMQYPEKQKMTYIWEFIRPQHDYLFYKLFWGEYLITEIQEFTDEEGHVSRCYGITYTFQPEALGNRKIYLNLLWMIPFLFLVIKALIIYLLPWIKIIFLKII